MPIKRAGPWGNITNSFQDVPGNTGADGLTLYPVNCAKTNWVSGQAWGAYYEVVEPGCCTPETIHVYWWVFSETIEFDVSRTDAGGCEYYHYDSGSWTFTLTWDESAPSYPQWYAETDAGFSDAGYGQVPDNQCDPTTSTNFYTVGGTLLITIPT